MDIIKLAESFIYDIQKNKQELALGKLVEIFADEKFRQDVHPFGRIVFIEHGYAQVNCMRRRNPRTEEKSWERVPVSLDDLILITEPVKRYAQAVREDLELSSWQLKNRWL